MLEPDQFAALARSAMAEDVIGRRLDAERILPGLQVLPFVHAGELVFAGDDFEADAERIVDERHRDLSFAIRGHFVLPDLFMEVELRSRHRVVTDALLLVVRAGVGGPDDFLDRRQIAGILRQDRMAHIDVVAIHMRGAVEAAIGHPVGEPDLVGARFDLYAAHEVEMLSKDGPLGYDALTPEDAIVTPPLLAITREPRRDRPDPAMQRVTDVPARAVNIGVAGFVRHEQDVVETAGHHQAGERSQPGKSTLAFIFVQARMFEAGRRIPTDRHAAIVAIGDIEGAVDEHGKAQACPAAEFKHSDSAFDAICKRHEPHAGKLRKRSRLGCNVAARHRLPVEFYHLGCSCRVPGRAVLS